MENLNTPAFLKIETVEQLNALQQALDMVFVFENDTALDELVTTSREVRKLSLLSDDELHADLRARREATDERMNTVPIY